MRAGGAARPSTSTTCTPGACVSNHRRTSGTAWGGGGGDTLIGGNGNDHLYGGFGLDLLKGMGGNDTLDGGERTDSLAGGAGDDVLIMTDGEKDFYDGGTGTNTFSKDPIDVYKPLP